MKQYAKIGEALGVELGWEAGAFTRAYAENLETAARAIVENDSIFEPLLAFLDDHSGEWEGTYGQLQNALALKVGNAEVMKNKGVAEHWQGDVEQARPARQRAHAGRDLDQHPDADRPDSGEDLQGAKCTAPSAPR